jgi:hypothetical protein
VSGGEFGVVGGALPLADAVSLTTGGSIACSISGESPHAAHARPHGREPAAASSLAPWPSAESTTDGERVGSEIDLGWGALEVEEQKWGPVKYLHRTSHHARLAHAVVARTPVLHVPQDLHIPPLTRLLCVCFVGGP